MIIVSLTLGPLLLNAPLAGKSVRRSRSVFSPAERSSPRRWEESRGLDSPSRFSPAEAGPLCHLGTSQIENRASGASASGRKKRVRRMFAPRRREVSFPGVRLFGAAPLQPRRFSYARRPRSGSRGNNEPLRISRRVRVSVSDISAGGAIRYGRYMRVFSVREGETEFAATRSWPFKRAAGRGPDSLSLSFSLISVSVVAR